MSKISPMSSYMLVHVLISRHVYKLIFTEYLIYDCNLDLDIRVNRKNMLEVIVYCIKIGIRTYCFQGQKVGEKIAGVEKNHLVNSEIE